MSEVTILSGLPASGKTEWAKNYLFFDPKAVIISPDQIRGELTGDVADQSRNDEVFLIAIRRYRLHLLTGKDIIIDATNLTTSERNQWIHEAQEFGAGWEVVELRTPFLVCLWRNWRRKRTVPFKVMWRMWGKLRAERKARMRR